MTRRGGARPHSTRPQDRPATRAWAGRGEVGWGWGGVGMRGLMGRGAGGGRTARLRGGCEEGRAGEERGGAHEAEPKLGRAGRVMLIEDEDRDEGRRVSRRGLRRGPPSLAAVLGSA